MKKFFIPIAIFLLLAVLLWVGLSLDPKKIPSPLIGKPLPDFNLSQLRNQKKLISKKDLPKEIYLLNVWASWCAACRQEHPLLMELKANKLVTIIGHNYKDKPEDGIGFLNALGDPYEYSISDRDGRLGMDLGVYGVPETFVVNEKGIIIYKHIGPLNADDISKTILPLVINKNNQK